jgi:protein TonB
VNTPRTLGTSRDLTADVAAEQAAEQAARRTRQIGLGVVIGAHVLIGWWLLQPTLRELPARLKVIEAAILDAPPPPPPPPPPARLVETPRPVTPPAPAPVAPKPPPPTPTPAPAPQPVAAPAPEPRPIEPVAVPAPPAPAPAPPVVPAPPAPAPAPPIAVPAPPAPAAPRAPAMAEVAVVCPGYRRILETSLADEWNRVGIDGVVEVLFKVSGNRVSSVQAVSGPKEYHRAVQRAVSRFKCSVDGAEERDVRLEVSFKEAR